VKFKKSLNRKKEYSQGEKRRNLTSETKMVILVVEHKIEIVTVANGQINIHLAHLSASFAP
jgi:hypothetical protein